MTGRTYGYISSSLFKTLNAVYSSGFQQLFMIWKSLWRPLRLSDCKTRQIPTNVILRAKGLIFYQHVTCNTNGNLSILNTGHYTTVCTLPWPCFQELNSKSGIVYKVANPFKIYLTSRFREFSFIQAISFVVYFEVSSHSLRSSKWSRMCQSHSHTGNWSSTAIPLWYVKIEWYSKGNNGFETAAHLSICYTVVNNVLTTTSSPSIICYVTSTILCILVWFC